MTDTKTAAPAAEKKAERAAPKNPTHIRFIGHPTDDENSSCAVFGKVFYRGKWVPLANLNGGNKEKRALDANQLRKLIGVPEEGIPGNPAFQLGNGEDEEIPGVIRRDFREVEEA